MKKIFIYILILLCWLPMVAGAQENTAPLINSIIPPSPISSVFRQFVGYTPNLSTGTVNIPIELYNIQVGNYSLPISMQYYTQGIKLTDDPYPLGYGWMLSPGLRITRTIMGRPDMEAFPMMVQPEDEENDFEYGKRALHDEHNLHAELSRDTLIDTQHDIFTLHLPHANHTFFLEKQEDGSYQALTCNNQLRITVNHRMSIDVTDENGVLYRFGTNPEGDTEGEFYELYDGRYPTSWMLRKIVLPDKREMDFTWETVNHSLLAPYHSAGGDALRDYKDNQGDYPEDPHPTYTSAEELGLLQDLGNYREVLHLKNIVFPGGKVEFTYKTTTNPMLTRMTVSNSNNRVVKSVEFTYGEDNSQRLLLSVEFSDEGIYRFSYNEKRFLNQNAQDWWGYYNEKANTSLVPQMNIRTYVTRYSGGENPYRSYGYADRSVDTTAMQANMLVRVEYPTGGYTAFEYEAHRFEGSLPTNEGLSTLSRFQLTEGGGLRIKKVTSRADAEAPEVVKYYTYGKAESGLAIVLHEPTLETFIEELNGYSAEVFSETEKFGYNHRQLLLNPQSDYMRYAFNEPALWYDVVTEQVEDAGKTEYRFQRLVSPNIEGFEKSLDFSYKYPVACNTLFSAGCMLVSQAEYARQESGFTLTRKSVYSYKLVEDENCIADVCVSRRVVSLLSNGPDFNFNDRGCTDGTTNINGFTISEPIYTISPLTYRFYYEQPEGVTTYHYTPADTLVEKSEYLYQHDLLLQTKHTRSDGSTVLEKYSYPKDYLQVEETAQQEVLKGMYDRNLKGVRFRTERIVNNSSTETERTEYALFHNSFYLPHKFYHQQGDEEEVLLGEYDYTPAGNVRSLTERGTRKHAMLWGYGETLPVAIIEGMDYQEVKALTDSLYLTQLDSGNETSRSGALEAIRSGIGSLGKMTSYQYEPLVGMTEWVDPSGKRNRYLYDSRNRLQQVKDHEDAKVAQYAYLQHEDSMTVAFEAGASYTYGARQTFAATVTGGSGCHSYEWTLKNSAGTVLSMTTASENGQASIALVHTGMLTLTCNVLDVMTGETATCSRSMQVSLPVVQFTDVINQSDYAAANIYCDTEMEVTLNIGADIVTGGSATFMLDGNSYTLYSAGSENCTLTLEAGYHAFYIYLENDEEGNNTASLSIVANSAAYQVGTPHTIQAYRM